MGDVAVNYLAGWTAWGWIAAVAGLLVSAAVLVAAPLLVWDGEDGEQAGALPAPVRIGGWILAPLSLLSVTVLPGVMMRHSPEQWQAGLILLGMVIAGGLFAYLGFWFRTGGNDAARWFYWVPALGMVLGGGLGWVLDAIARVAAGIPMPTATLIAIIVLAGVIFVFGKRN